MRCNRTTNTRTVLTVLAAGILGLAGCGGSGSDAGGSDGGSNTADATPSSDGGSPGGGLGTATLTIGDETWEFTQVRCTESTGSQDYDFSLSAIENGLQLSVDRGAAGGRYGDGIELDDITDFENPSVSWSAPGPAAAVSGTAAPFVEVDGDTVTATAEFVDGTADPSAGSAGVSGTLEAQCP